MSARDDAEAAQAAGMLMAELGVSIEEASSLLELRAASVHRTVPELARELVRQHEEAVNSSSDRWPLTG